MKQLSTLLVISLYFFSCDDDIEPAGFAQHELSPIVKFTQGNEVVRISNSNTGLWASAEAIDENGEEIADKSTKGFGSVIDSSGNGKYQVTILISKWVTDEEIDYVSPTVSIEVIKPEYFKSIFSPGIRRYAKNANPIYTSNEVVIEYFDGTGVRWSSSYQGNYYSTPPYDVIQPSSNFTITRSMPVGNDSVFVEAKFTVRLYKNDRDYFEIKDGYFKGYYFRRL